ncbi:MAG: hypothetical protein JXR40_03345 [Pontiellaceae bacterium]|nr:hypothetical protein [Pontiellaceae bacterium]
MNDSNDAAMMVLYVLVRRTDNEDNVRFLTRKINDSFTFPPTKLKPDEDLYKALDRIMEGDLSLPRKSFYPEHEFEVIERAPDSPEYAGLSGQWYLYPTLLSLTEDAMTRLESDRPDVAWMTLEEMEQTCKEPNTREIIQYLRTDKAKAVLQQHGFTPSMNARACYWARFHDDGVRIVRGETVKSILNSGDRAFNLRVADPYLPYQKQGMGFTWSFFTPKDNQDLHVHGMPAVEIYGVQEGRLQLWWKPMNARGVRVWQHRILVAGDWAEVEPLNCHFAAWLTPQGLGTVIKAAGSGELAGVGRLGVSGKTVCKKTEKDGTELKCSNHDTCTLPPPLQNLIAEFEKPYADRDFDAINRYAKPDMKSVAAEPK